MEILKGRKEGRKRCWRSNYKDIRRGRGGAIRRVRRIAVTKKKNGNGRKKK